MHIKGKEKTQRPLCHRPLMTASYVSRDGFFKLLKRFISYLYVCMHVCMRVLIYLFNSIQRTFFQRGQASWPFALGWMCQRKPGCFRGPEPPADLLCRQAVSTLCPLGKLPMENSSRRLTRICGYGLGHLGACCEFHCCPPNKEGQGTIPLPRLKMP